MPKKTHAADAANLALIPLATKFSAAILAGRKHTRVELPTLEAARTEAARMNATANNGRKALVYAIGANGESILVPENYQIPTEAEVIDGSALKKAAALRAEIKADRKPAAKKAKPAPKAKAARAPKDGTKAGIAYKMLTRKAGTTRAAIVEACDGWGIDVKQFCERKSLKLRKDDEGVFYATAK